MKTPNPAHDRYLEILSQLLIQDEDADLSLLASKLKGLDSSDDDLTGFLAFADLHHVLVRGLEAIEALPAETMRESSAHFCASVLARERERISRALGVLKEICEKLESAGCSAVVIKSLDHWPDLGSDLDLFSRGDDRAIVEVMQREFKAQILPRSWGDRLAHKWNFRVPGLPEAVEIHVGCLGQTGEHLSLARRVTDRAMRRQINRDDFWVPAPEERVMITTLQRMYRHFYCRLCDIVDTGKLIQAGQIDYDKLGKAAEPSGIWPGVASFLVLVAEYSAGYGLQLYLPQQVLSAARQGQVLRLRGKFLRIPIVPEAASLFVRQMVNAGFKNDVRTVARLSLLPALAAAALVAYKVSGDDKGIW